MDFNLKFILCFFLLSAATEQFESDLVEDAEEKPRQLHIDQNTRESFKSDMDSYFSKLWKMMTKRNAETILRLERHQEALSANLSREFNENMSNLYRNLSDSFTQNSARSDLKVERSLRNLSDSVNEQLLRVESKVTGELQLLRSDLKGTEELGNLNETLRRNPEDLPQSISNLTTSILQPTSTEVEEVNADNGTIEFAGGTNPHLRTKIWVLQSKGGDSYRSLSFLLEEFVLEDASLSLWGSGGGDQQTWNVSEADWREERKNSGNVILVILRISPGGEKPSFKLNFKTTGAWRYFTCSSQLLLEDGRQVVSFPPNNTENYPRRSLFVAVVAPPQGGSFQLSLKFLDLPGIPPTNCDNNFYVFFLEESPTGLPFAKLPSSAYRECGRVGAISEPLGDSTVAILWFWTDDQPVGRGFQVEMN